MTRAFLRMLFFTLDYYQLNILIYNCQCLFSTLEWIEEKYFPSKKNRKKVSSSLVCNQSSPKKVVQPI